MYAQHASIQACSCLTVVLVVGIYIGQWCVYCRVCHPDFSRLLIFNVIFWLALLSYVRTVVTDPGTRSSPEFQEWMDVSDTEAQRRRGVPPGDSSLAAKSKPQVSSRNEVVSSGSENNSDAQRSQTSTPRSRSRRSGSSKAGWKPGELTRCKECGYDRPERAHHCSVCGTCILLMDHHCPWIGNCIGLRNQKYFILMNWWTCLSCIMIVFTMQRPSLVGAIPFAAEQSLWPLLGGLMATLFALVTGSMAAFAFSMVVSNVTAIEENYTGRNPYNLDSRLDNLISTFGTPSWRWFFPLEPHGRSCGTSFKVCGEEDPAGKPASGGSSGSAGGAVDGRESVGNGQATASYGTV